jgi:hypothetical protein
MEHRHVRLVWALASSLASLCIGVVVAVIFAIPFFIHGQDSAAIANATVAVATLNHLSSNDIQAASVTLRLQLRASLDELAARETDLTQSQKAFVSKLRTRAAPLLRESQ